MMNKLLLLVDHSIYINKKWRQQFKNMSQTLTTLNIFHFYLTCHVDTCSPNTYPYPNACASLGMIFVPSGDSMDHLNSISQWPSLKSTLDLLSSINYCLFDKVISTKLLNYIWSTSLNVRAFSIEVQKLPQNPSMRIVKVLLGLYILFIRVVLRIFYF